jgi:hypothetical protein
MLTILILEQSQSTQNFRGFSISDTQVFAHLAEEKFYMKGRTYPSKKKKRKKRERTTRATKKKKHPKSFLGAPKNSTARV